MRASRRVEGEQGESLIELVVAIAILGVCVVAIASGIALSVKVSDIHRKQTTAGAYVRSYAEAIESTVSNSAWQGCSASAATYQTPAGFSLPSNGGYTATVDSAVKYWNPTTRQFDPSCGTDTGLQQLTLTVATTDQRASERLVVIIRKPCATSCS